MGPSTRALTIAEVRKVLRNHPEFTAAIGLEPAADLAKWSASAAGLIQSNSEIVNSISQVGLVVPPGRSEPPTLVKWLAAADILRKTFAAHDPADLASAIFQEIAEFTLPSGAIQ